MTDNRTPIDDELVSAYLDGEVTETERAAVESDADAMARVVELRIVRDAVAAPVAAPSAADRDRLIAAALAASETSPVVTSIAARSALRRAWRPLAAVAAVALLLVLAVSALSGRDLGDDADDTASEEPADDATTFSIEEPTDGAGGDAATEAQALDDTDTDDSAADEDAAEPAEEAAEEPAEDSGDDAGGEAASMPFEPLSPMLGDFATVDEVVAQAFDAYGLWLADAEAALSRSTASDADEPSDTCLDELELRQRVADQASDAATATVGLELQVVWLFEDGTVFVAPVSTCSPIVTETFTNG